MALALSASIGAASAQSPQSGAANPWSTSVAPPAGQPAAQPQPVAPAHAPAKQRKKVHPPAPTAPETEVTDPGATLQPTPPPRNIRRRPSATGVTPAEVPAAPVSRTSPAAAAAGGPIIVRPPATAAPTAIGAAAKTTMPNPAANTGPTGSGAPKSRDCLTVQQLGAGAYKVENAGCRDSTVMATIEVHHGGRNITCYIARIRDSYAVASGGSKAPLINYQCRSTAPGCTEAALKAMFPECRGPG